MPLAFWICVAITAISAYVSLGYSIAGLRGSDDDAARTASKYALARSSALAVAATVAPFTQAVAFLVAVAVAMIVVQASDAVIGAGLRDRLKTIGPALTAAANAAALVWLLLSPHL